jgi:plasmid maintenance system antidote protein VapI
MSHYEDTIQRIEDVTNDLWQYRSQAMMKGDDKEAKRLLDSHDLMITSRRLIEELNEHEMMERAEEMHAVTPGEMMPAAGERSPLAQRLYEVVPEGWSAQDLAEASGVSQNTIKNLLSGRTTTPHRSTLEKLEQALGLDEPLDR